jgi:hypothetical protein
VTGLTVGRIVFAFAPHGRIPSVTQQPPPGQGGYYQSQYSGQPSYPEQPQYPEQQQPSYPQQPSYQQQQPSYEQPGYPQQPAYPQQPSYQQQQPAYGQQPPAQYSPQQSPYSSQYSQDPPPSSPYPSQQQGGYDYQAPSGYQQPGYYPGGATPTPPKKGRGKLFGILGAVGGAVVLLIGVRVAFALLGGAAGDAITDNEIESQTPEVGECITEESLTATDTTVVDCGAADAAWRTLGYDGTMSQTDFAAADVETMCTEFETTGYVLWIGEIGGDGTLVCLEEVTAE